jgi:hypothetical protein
MVFGSFNSVVIAGIPISKIDESIELKEMTSKNPN